MMKDNKAHALDLSKKVDNHQSQAVNPEDNRQMPSDVLKDGIDASVFYLNHKMSTSGTPAKEKTASESDIELSKHDRSIGNHSDLNITQYSHAKTQSDCPLTIRDEMTTKQIKELSLSKLPAEVKSIDEAISLVGSFGRYQRHVCVYLTILFCIGNLCVYPMGFYQLQPQYQCRKFDAEASAWTAWTHCTNEEACRSVESQLDEAEQYSKAEYRIDYSSEMSLNNWVQKFDMQCSPKKYFGLFGMMYFGGATLGALVLPRLSDKYGRKRFTLVPALMHTFACAAILLSDNLIRTYAMIFLQGFSMPGRAILGYVWLTEVVHIEQVTKMTSLMFVTDSFGIFFAALYFKYVSKDWTQFYLFPTLLIFVSTIALCFFDDSPKFYYGNKQYDKARLSLTKIGRKNGILGPNESFDCKFTQELRCDQNVEIEKHSAKDFAKNRRNLCNAIVTIIIFMVCPFCYHQMNFYIKYIPGDIYINQIANSIAEAIAQGPLTLLFMHFLSIKSTFLINFTMSILCYIFIIICSHQLWLTIMPWAVLLTKVSISLQYCLVYITVAHYFEPQYTGLIMGFANVISRINNTFAPMAAELDEPIPLLISIFYCFIALCSTTMLKKVENNSKVQTQESIKDNEQNIAEKEEIQKQLEK